METDHLQPGPRIQPNSKPFRQLQYVRKRVFPGVEAGLRVGGQLDELTARLQCRVDVYLLWISDLHNFLYNHDEDMYSLHKMNGNNL